MPWGHERIDSLDIVHNRHDTASEEQKERDDAEDADGVQEEEEVWVKGLVVCLQEDVINHVHLRKLAIVSGGNLRK